MRIYWDTFWKKWVRPPRNQFPTGSIVFKGFQGSGKSLSLCKYALDISHDFPKCLVFSNMKINGIKNFTFIENDEDLKKALSVRNGEGGVLVLLDEAHLYFNKKSGISLDVLTAISQQRKDRRRLAFTSQIWEELDISLRKQVKHIVSCRCIAGRIQVNTISDGETLAWNNLNSCYEAKKIRTEIFKHNISLYNAYDTYQKIISNDEYCRIPTTPPTPSIIAVNPTAIRKGNRIRK